MIPRSNVPLSLHRFLRSVLLVGMVCGQTISAQDPLPDLPPVQVSDTGLVQTLEPTPVPVATQPAGRKASWLVIPGLFSFPETGPGLALKARVRDLGGVPGYVDATLAVTMKQQADLSLEWLRDSIGGLWRSTQSVGVGRFPGVWYGPGNPAPDSARARYTPSYLESESRLARYLSDGWAVEGALFLTIQDNEDENEGALLSDAVVARGGTLGAMLGGGVEFEGRDMPSNPRKGTYLRTRGRVSVPGARHRWSSWQTDASQTVSFGPLITVGRIRVLDAWGDIPYWEMPLLGSREALRGLPEGRLRGTAVQCAGVEVRYELPWVFGVPTQLAVFGEEGRAGTHSSVWSASPSPAGGGGVRVLLDGGNAVLRVDYGVSEVGSGLYIDFGHSF